MVKRKEPVNPTLLGLLVHLFLYFPRRIFFPFRQRAAMVDIFLIDRQARVIRVKGGHQIITAHGGFSNKLHVSDIDFIDVQTAVLTAQGLFPPGLVRIAQHIDLLVPAGSVQDQMRHAVIPATLGIILHHVAEVIQDAQLLGDDVLLHRALVKTGQDVQTLAALGYTHHKLEQSHCGLASSGGPLQELHRCTAAKKGLVLLRQDQISHWVPRPSAAPKCCPAFRYPAWHQAAADR